MAEIAAEYRDDGDALARLCAKVKSGGQGTWGQVPMPPNALMKHDDIRAPVKWILEGAG